MSMYRQLLLAITLSTLLALLGGLLAHTLNTQSHLSEQLSAKNNDNAAALALALSQQNSTSTLIELTVAALFDSGHYEQIRVVDPLGITIVDKTAPASTQGVPAWFVKALPLYATPGQAQISSGWYQVGTLTLISNSGKTYQSLWKGVLQLVAALATAGLVSGFLAATILGRLHEPVQRVINQANAISERRFVVIDLPDVPELRQLAMAMNDTVMRLKAMFAEETQHIEELRIAANHDKLTGLANRTFFLVQLLDALDSEEAEGSTLLLVRVATSARGQQLGLGAVDDLLKTVGETLRNQARQSFAVAARLGDVDFALLLPAEANAREVANQLLASLVKGSTPQTAGGPVTYISTGKLTRGQDMPSLMAQVTSALVAAEAQGVSAIRETNPQPAERSDLETAALIKLALEQNRARLRQLPVTNMQGQLLHRECTMELLLGGATAWEPARHVMQAAEAGDLTPAMDVQAIRLAQEALAAEPQLTGLSITLSTLSISAGHYGASLLEQIRKHPELAGRLWLEVPESEALKHLDSFRNFATHVRHAGSHVGLKHFSRHFAQADTLHDLGLDFLKVDSAFVRGLHFSADNQVFLKSLVSAAHKMEMQVFAEGLVDRAELAALQAAGFDGVAGPAVKESASINPY